MKMTHVLIVVPSITTAGGGVSEVVRLHANELMTISGNRVSIVTLSDEGQFDPAHWPGISISFHKKTIWGRFGISLGMFKAIWSSSADVVHVHGLWMFHCLCVYLKSLFKPTRYFVTPHGMLDPWILKRSKLIKGFVSFFYQRTFVCKANGVQALTAFEFADVIKYCEGFHEHCYLIPNFVEVHVSPTTSPPWLTKDLDKKDIYLFFGRIHEKKGWKELLDAWQQLCKKNLAFAERSELVFAGWVDGSLDFDETISKAKRTFGNVRFVGPQFGDARLSTLQRASALLLPSKSEGLPMVVLEAWAMGLPTIMTPECNLPIGFEERAAIEIECDPESIAGGIEHFSNLTALQRQQFIDASREVVRRYFSAPSVIGQILMMYQGTITTVGSSLPASD